jgi:hypothetical protein
MATDERIEWQNPGHTLFKMRAGLMTFTFLLDPTVIGISANLTTGTVRVHPEATVGCLYEVQQRCLAAKGR